MFRGGYKEQKSQIILHFFVQDIYTGTVRARQIGTFGKTCLLVGYYILVYGREHVTLRRHVDGDTKCCYAKGSIFRSSVQSGKDIPLSFVWLGIYVYTSFDREEEE